ncbi:MAG: hypothetical protein KAT68_08125 [Bacteroidales bacterium]|nr:hypothetical protein [Bacteroidales bacterium]
MVKKVLYTLFLLSICVLLFGQADTIKLVKYSPDFKFYDGIYLNFQQVKNNKPIPKSRIITKVDIYSLDFFNKVLMKKKVSFYDNFGIKQEYSVDDLWGYSRNGSLYINWGNTFNRIPFVGSISHFIANVTVYQDRPYNPYYSSYYYYNVVQPQQTTKEMRQFILDFETGKILNYNYETVLVILMKDTELYDEYNNLKKKKKKQLKFLYLRKYNEKYPLYIPVH